MVGKLFKRTGKHHEEIMKKRIKFLVEILRVLGCVVSLFESRSC